jgi:hypothetical protein
MNLLVLSDKLFNNTFKEFSALESLKSLMYFIEFNNELSKKSILWLLILSKSKDCKASKLLKYSIFFSCFVGFMCLVELVQAKEK